MLPGQWQTNHVGKSEDCTYQLRWSTPNKGQEVAWSTKVPAYVYKPKTSNRPWKFQVFFPSWWECIVLDTANLLFRHIFRDGVTFEESGYNRTQVWRIGCLTVGFGEDYWNARWNKARVMPDLSRCQKLNIFISRGPSIRNNENSEMLVRTTCHGPGSCGH